MNGQTLLVSRHPGAQQWLAAEAAARGWRDVALVAHLGEELLAALAPARVAGIFPLALAARLSRRGVELWHLDLDAGPRDRGREITYAEMERLGARLCRYEVREFGPW